MTRTVPAGLADSWPETLPRIRPAAASRARACSIPRRASAGTFTALLRVGTASDVTVGEALGNPAVAGKPLAVGEPETRGSPAVADGAPMSAVGNPRGSAPAVGSC